MYHIFNPETNSTRIIKKKFRAIRYSLKLSILQEEIGRFTSNLSDQMCGNLIILSVLTALKKEKKNVPAFHHVRLKF